MKFVLGFAATLAAFGTAHAQMTYTSQTRRVTAETDAGSQTLSSDALGSWNETALSHNPFGSATAIGAQTSDLRPDGISFSSRTSGSNQNAFTAVATTLLDVTFTLSVGSLYEVWQPPQTFNNMLCRMTTGTSTMFEVPWGTNNSNNPVSVVSGYLPPGTYRFRANMSSAASHTGQDSAQNGYADFVINIPSPATAALLAIWPITSLRRRR